MFFEPFGTVDDLDFSSQQGGQSDIILGDAVEFVRVDINLKFSVVGQMKIGMMIFPFRNGTKGIQSIHGGLEILGGEFTGQHGNIG